MELDELWKSHQWDSQPYKQPIVKAIREKSSLYIHQLIRRYIRSYLISSGMVASLLILAFLYIHNPLMILACLLTGSFFGIALILMTPQLYKFRKLILSDPPQEVIEKALQIAIRINRTQLRLYNLLIPFSVSGGFMVGFMLQGSRLMELWQKPWLLLLTVLLISLFTGLGYWLRKFFRNNKTARLIASLEEQKELLRQEQ
jgi:hypothetical protein